MSESSRTPYSLLADLGAGGPERSENWKKFVEIYGKRIAYWCHRGGLKIDDVEDVSAGCVAQAISVHP
jgi:hypothetical protein